MPKRSRLTVDIPSALKSELYELLPRRWRKPMLTHTILNLIQYLRDKDKRAKLLGIVASKE